MSRSLEPTARNRLGALVILGAYSLLNLATWWRAEPVTTWDSPRYTGGDIFTFLNPGVPPTALFSIVTDLRIATLIQTILYVGAWLSLAMALLQSLRTSWIRWPLVTLALLVSLTSPLWSWNLFVGSEGLTVTSLVFWMSTLMWLASRSRRLMLVISGAAAAILLITRPQAILFVLPIQIVATVWWARRHSWPSGEITRFVIPVFLVVLLATGWAGYRLALLANDDVFAFRYALNNLVEKEPSFRQYVLKEAPPCEAIPAALNGPQPWNDVQAFDQTLIGQCPETFLWFKSDAVSIPTWVLYDPVAAATNFRDVLWGIALPGGSETSPLPVAIDDVVLPINHLWLATFIALSVGVGLGVLGGIRFQISAMAVLGLTITVISIAAYLFAVWAADGYDVIRHMVPVTPLLPVAALVLPSGMTGLARPPSTSTRPGH